jgi:hypothetical protein
MNQKRPIISPLLSLNILIKYFGIMWRNCNDTKLMILLIENDYRIRVV